MPANFVGRAHELSVLQQSVDSAASGDPGWVLIEGDGGTGKTSLLRAFGDGLPGASLVSATGDEAEAELPYGVLHELARQLGASGINAVDPSDPFVVGAAFLQQLGAWRGPGPLVLMLDDAHLADAASLAAMTFAMRRLQADPILIVLTAREEGVVQLPRGLLRLVSDRGTRLTLHGLSVDEVRRLAQAAGFGRLSPRAAARLRDHTEGKPLHLRALFAELTLEQAEALGTPLPVPRSLSLLVLGTVGAMSAQGQQLAAAIAVLGTTSTLADAATVAGLDDARAAADELIASQIAVPAGGQSDTVLRFTHPLMRAAIYGDIGLLAKARLHLRAAMVRSGAEALTHRVAAARRPDPALVAALRVQAVEERMSGRLGAAATSLLAASRLCDAQPDKDRLIVDAVDVWLLEGDMAAAMEFASALEQMPPSAQRLQVQARMAWMSGRNDDAQALGLRAWALAADLDPSECDRLAAMLAQISILKNEAAAATEWTGQALASGLLPPDIACATRATVALGLAMSGRSRDGLALLVDLPSDPADVPNDKLQLLGMRGMLRMVVEDLAGARADLVLSSPSTGSGVRPHQLTALAALVEVEYRTGDWESCAAHASQLIGLIEDTEQVWLLAYAHFGAVLVPAARGQWGRAEAHLAQAELAAGMLNDPASRAYTDAAAMHLAYCRGNPDDVVSAAQTVLGDQSGAAREPGIFCWPPQYATALVDLHRLQEAESLLTGMEQRARDRGHRSSQAALARVRGEVEAARHRTGEARSAFMDALRLADPPGDAVETAMIHAAYGRFLRRRGERRSAVQQLEEALARFADLGAAPFMERCEQELAACGRTTARPETRFEHGELTPQELAVARLVSLGRRNQEIADELVLSVKTVSYHLGHVYAKLGVRSRTELAAQWQIPEPSRGT